MYGEKGVMNLLYKAADWLIRLISINFIWAISSLPVLYLAFSMFLSNDINQLLSLGFIALIISPFILFPATTAMYSLIRKWIMKKDVKVFRTYFQQYKNTYVRSMIGGILIALMWIILIVDYYFFITHVSEWFKYIFIVLAFYLLVFTFHFFSLTVHVYAKLRETVKNAFLLTVGAPLFTAGIGLISLIVVYLTYQLFVFFTPFVAGAILAYLSFFGFYKIFTKIQLEKKEEAPLNGDLPSLDSGY